MSLSFTHLPSCVPLLHPAFRDFFARMDALSSVWERLFGPTQGGMNTVSGPISDPCLPSLNFPVVRSPNTYRCPRGLNLVVSSELTARVHARIPIRGPKRLGLRLSTAGSPQRSAESSSLSYRPTVRLGLLSTPPRSDAVTFGYQSQVQALDEDFHLTNSMRSQAHSRGIHPTAQL